MKLRRYVIKFYNFDTKTKCISSYEALTTKLLSKLDLQTLLKKETKNRKNFCFEVSNGRRFTV